MKISKQKFFLTYMHDKIALPLHKLKVKRFSFGSNIDIVIYSLLLNLQVCLWKVLIGIIFVLVLVNPFICLCFEK